MGKKIANPAKVEANAQSIAAVQDGLAYIVGNTNTTGSTLAVGQFVYVKGHSTIDEGLRKVTASISANANITTSNTSACSEGGLNALNSNIANKLDKANVYNGLDKTASGFALDARQGKALNDKMVKTDQASLSFDSTYGASSISKCPRSSTFVLCAVTTDGNSLDLVCNSSQTYWQVVNTSLKGTTKTVRFAYINI